MEMGSYDSPTFLGQRDKYLMGLSLPQLMVAAVCGGGLVPGQLCVRGRYACPDGGDGGSDCGESVGPVCQVVWVERADVRVFEYTEDVREAQF